MCMCVNMAHCQCRCVYMHSVTAAHSGQLDIQTGCRSGWWPESITGRFGAE